MKANLIERTAQIALTVTVVMMVLSAVHIGRTAASPTGLDEAFVFAPATVCAFLGFPRRRRTDLCLALLVLTGFVGLVPSGRAGFGDLTFLAASAGSVLTVYALSQLEALRARMRERPEGPLLRTAEEERRNGWSLFLRPRAT